MKTKTLKKNKVNVVTLGCSKNIFDSEVMMAQLKANNFEVEHESQSEDSEIVIINTCGFIDNAKEESINTILQFSEAKDAGLVDKVYVTGCLSERYKNDLQNEITNVDAYFGTRELPRLLKTLKADYKKELIGERLLTTPSHYAYFKIADKELMLIAQDLTYYGLDLYGKRDLADLLRELSDVNGLDWIRLHYAYPSGFPMEVIDVMKERDNICNYLDIPLQHGSTNMLKAMRRGITREKTTNLIHDIRNKIPEIAIRTTLITGFPGETQADFEEMYQWVEEMKFDRLGCFTYSHEENTHAYNFEDNVPEEVKKLRADDIMELQSGISHNINQNKVGQTLKVLFDKVEGDYFIGRSEFDSPDVDNEILVPKADFVRLGDFANVTIEKAESYDLYGRVKP